LILPFAREKSKLKKAFTFSTSNIIVEFAGIMDLIPY
jgi:hypothetical protein